MQYVGSKNRIAKSLSPIIQSYITADTKGYIEPFVGGANMIDKINCSNKVGYDIHDELIALLQYVQSGGDLPNTISNGEYCRVRDNQSNYENWYVGLVGFCGSYGAKYFGGYAKGNDDRDRQNEAIRNLHNQSSKLQEIEFINASFLELDKDEIKGYVIYCDPPYRNTTTYKTEKFPYDEFYDWCIRLSEHNTVLISEYNMPEDKFECIWCKENKANFDNNRKVNDKTNIRVEKLFKVK